jgi:adenosylcobinamide kinase/adenosylcobinamide-phosphate guanylyltransferase
MMAPTALAAGRLPARAGRTLITGGVRSGKSRFAESLAGAHSGTVRYVAPGYPPDDDGEWAARVAAHRSRRPPHWQTVETIDVAGMLAGSAPGDLLLVDCLTTWLTRQLDEAGAWTDAPGWGDRVDAATDALVAAWSAGAATVVAVTNEIGLGVVPATASGRLFRDRLGTLNQRIAAASDRVYLVVVGRVLDLSAAPPVWATPPPG